MKFLSNIFKGEEQMAKNVTMKEVNVDDFFEDNIFSGTIRFAKQNSSLNGVLKVISDIEEKNRQYIEERRSFVESRKIILFKRLKTWKILIVIIICQKH